jgi:hypothetical protein
MGVDYSTMIYLPTYDMFARPVTITPLASEPNGAAYPARGIYNHNRMNVLLEDGSTFVEQETILDIRAAEFITVPEQGDEVYIGPDGNDGMPAVGDFVITSTWDNGGGEINLHLRKKMP